MGCERGVSASTLLDFFNQLQVNIFSFIPNLSSATLCFANSSLSMWHAGPRIRWWSSKRRWGGDQGGTCVWRRGRKSKKTFRQSDFQTFKDETVSEEEVANQKNFQTLILKFDFQVRALERDRQKKDNHNISETFFCLFKIFLGHEIERTLKEDEWVNDLSKKSSTRRVPSQESTFCCPPWKVLVCFASNYFTIITFGLFWSCSVERRRRFNINDRIKELGGLLPAQVTSEQ